MRMIPSKARATDITPVGARPGVRGAGRSLPSGNRARIGKPPTEALFEDQEITRGLLERFLLAGAREPNAVSTHLSRHCCLSVRSRSEMRTVQNRQ